MKRNKPILKGLYGITDKTLMPDFAIMLESVQAALKGGMSILQYRDKHLDFKQQVAQAFELKALCEQYDALFIVNDSVDLAAEVSAHGVHLGRDDGELTMARQKLGSQAIIGCSCYDNLARAQSAELCGADYVAFGRFFASKTKPEATAVSIDILSQARSTLDIPVCAIGGITADNAPMLLHQGAHMLAVIHDLFAATDIEARARQLSDLCKA